MKLEDKLRILEELLESQAWEILSTHMESAILSAAMEMAEGRPMPESQYNFTRGAMWAAKRHLTLPETLIAQIKNELLMQMDPATAGKVASTVSLRPDNKEKDHA